MEGRQRAQEAHGAGEPEGARFSDLGLSRGALEAVARLGYEAPTPVQRRVVPLVLAGRDVLASAQTGTGKTAAFVLPALDRLDGRRAAAGAGPLMFVVTPTRELAEQILEVCLAAAGDAPLRADALYGGVPYGPQTERLRAGVEMLVATPGRALDLLEQGLLRLDAVRMLVVDEADLMLDAGFWPAVRTLADATPAARQTLLFSATVNEEVRKAARPLLRDPARVEIAPEGRAAELVEQRLVRTQRDVKFALLRALLAEYGAQGAIVFVRTRARAESLAGRLARAGTPVETIHSDRTQNQRDRALERFRAGEVGVLVATDVLARGIDVPGVGLVVNYDLPQQAQDYVHRIGRTGRAGAAGLAVTLATPEDDEALRAIERFVGHAIPPLALASFDEQEALREVYEQTQRIEARRDPEIRLALKEQQARERRRQKAREQGRDAAKPAAHGKKRSQHGASAPQRRRSTGGGGRRGKRAGGRRAGGANGRRR